MRMLYREHILDSAVFVLHLGTGGEIDFVLRIVRWNIYWLLLIQNINIVKLELF